MGISADDKANLFKSLRKGNRVVSLSDKKICEAHSWTIQEDKKQDEGARFIISSPKSTKDVKERY